MNELNECRNALYQKEYLIRLDGTFPVNVKVSRITDDSTSSKLSNAFKWENYVEITYDQRAYANSALVGMRVDAEQFTSNFQTSLDRKSWLLINNKKKTTKDG